MVFWHHLAPAGTNVQQVDKKNSFVDNIKSHSDKLMTDIPEQRCFFAGVCKIHEETLSAMDQNRHNFAILWCQIISMLGTVFQRHATSLDRFFDSFFCDHNYKQGCKKLSFRLESNNNNNKGKTHDQQVHRVSFSWNIRIFGVRENTCVCICFFLTTLCCVNAATSRQFIRCVWQVSRIIIVVSMIRNYNDPDLTRKLYTRVTHF